MTLIKWPYLDFILWISIPILWRTIYLIACILSFIGILEKVWIILVILVHIVREKAVINSGWCIFEIFQAGLGD